MDIQDALKENGKAICDEGGYVFVDEYGILQWYDTVNSTITAPAELNEILNSDWLPYPEEKEIKPETEGELWTNDHNINWFIYFELDRNRGWKAISEQGVRRDVDEMNIIHGKNGWTRSQRKNELP